MKWYAIENKYADYLRNSCLNVPFTNYGNNKLKCFLGIVLEINDYKYFAPLTHWKNRYENKPNNKTFIKIYDPKSQKYLAAICLLYMFPVPENQYFELTLSNLDKHRTFTTEKEKYQYWNLLEKEIKLINEADILKEAKNLHNEIVIKRNKVLLPIGIDYVVAEQKCLEYQNAQNKENQKESTETKSNVVSPDKKQPLDLKAYKHKANEYNDSRSSHKRNNDLEL